MPSLKIETVLVESLAFDPNNARKHSDANLSAIAQSLKEFGQRKPIVVTNDNVIVAGNGTVEAAQMIGLKNVDVVRVPKNWSAEQVKAFALADNRTAELAEWNEQVLSAQLLELQESGLDIEQLGFEVTPVADFDPVSEEENPPLDERVQHECPYCAGLFEMKNGKATAIE
jgi:ParB-like chromosome segregation protein Spo0J